MTLRVYSTNEGIMLLGVWYEDGLHWEREDALDDQEIDNAMASEATLVEQE